LFPELLSEKGIYKTAEFLALSGIYFYSLEKDNPEKIPVIFVHGYGGSPRDFAHIVSSIDTTLYKCCFFYYPSGQSLERSANIFYEIFLSGHIIQVEQKRLVIIAHSMGGLVARAALNMYSQMPSGVESIAYLSICTPYGGNEPANNASNAPLSVASWIDIGSKSAFIDKLNNIQLDKSISFYLFFGFQNNGSGKSGDGTIELTSQLHSSAQALASMVYGFDETHTSIIESKELTAKINTILQNP
jgi:pimeloyl-ACP methyl ester carboxylesterase